ncbi:MAG TPA: TetR/AcrR family transcriptional regulator [Candidatus Cybelea sp.]|nr:TetR/AcrR family transcriptional regulator [Candidatus Cybelea sp.]
MQAQKGRASRGGDGRHKKAAAKARSPAGRRSRGNGAGLSREAIVDAALDLIDREGLDAVSFRRLGEELGCEAMSLYHYLPSKAHLMDAVIDQVIGGLEVPPPGSDWIARVRQAAWNYRAMALGHPRLYPLIAVHRLNTRVGVRKLDQVLGLFREGGFDDATAARLFRDFGYYITGAALDETAGYAKGPSAAEPVSETEIARHCPNLAASAPYFKPQHFEETFRQGLELLLEGMARLRRSKAR